MIRYYLLMAFRNILKQRFYSVINIGGLAAGLACAILILLWVQDELSFDRFHTKSDALYRVNWDFKWNNNEGIGPGTPPPLAATLIKELPEIASAVRIYQASEVVVRNDDKFFSEANILGVDAGFFKMFDFTLVAGNPESALLEPNTVVLTESTARKYFGEESPVGKTLLLGEERKFINRSYRNAFKITGVVKDPPPNSHIRFDLLTSIASNPEVVWFDWSWIWMQVTTYVQLKDDATASAVEAKIPALVKTHAAKAFRRVGFSYEEVIQNGGHWNFVLQPFEDVYLRSGATGNRLGPVGNITYVYIFSLAAGFVLLIGCVNFMNLATARASSRAKEIGVRKVLGSQRSSLLTQFLIESFVHSFIALLTALFLVEILLPLFNDISGKSLELSFFGSFGLPASLLALTVGTGLLSGLYPGFYLSRFLPVIVLKRAPQPGRRGLFLRNALVVLQFSITITLFVCTFLVRDQMVFVRQTDLGMSPKGVVVVSNENNRLGNQVETFKQKLLNQSQVLDASMTTGIPPGSGFEDSFQAEGHGDETFGMASYMADERLLPTLGLRILQGRNFSKDFSAETRSVILNETAVRYLGWNDPIGKTITYPGAMNGPSTFTVIGVMKDFNFANLYSPITPFALFHHSAQSYTISKSYIVVRLPESDIAAGIKTLESEWKATAPTAPFEFHFLDESLEAQYRSDRHFGELFIAFSFLTIFIACIGLLGLAAFATERRTKEIGIRKVLGANVTGILGLLSREFLLLVAAANVLAWPVAYWGMSRWLENFAYRTDIGIGVFILSGSLAVSVALLTVGYQTLKAAMANPVKALKYE